MQRIILFIFLSFGIFCHNNAKVLVGLDVFFMEQEYGEKMKGKNIGLITNHTGVDQNLITAVEKFTQNENGYSLVALFSPEHGLDGSAYAAEKVPHKKNLIDLPVFSLHGATRRPTKEMLKNIDVLIYDIQSIGCRSYTYLATLFYAMEEAAKNNIQVIVLDRPNPINGTTVDGPFLHPSVRSFIGYIDVPYCHGMTIGELAVLFNEEYKIGCDLSVVPMKGWHRKMKFVDTGLHWIPPSPHIPEADTAYFYPATGLLGELKLLNIGVGYTLPFKIVGAPWLDAKKFAKALNDQKMEGVFFVPFFFRPFYGLYKQETCQGVKIMITDPEKYKPVSVQFLILGMLKSLYPKEFQKSMDNITASQKELFCKAVGNEKILHILQKEKYIFWKLLEFEKEKKQIFLKKRQRYLNKEYL